jgi:hypothetical protein
MRAPRFLLLAALACTGIARADDDGPMNVRVSIQLIEVPLPTLTGLMNGPDQSGRQLHAKAFDLTKTGKAKLVETCSVTARSGQRAIVESVLKLIYPTECGLPMLPNKVAANSPPPPSPPSSKRSLLRPPTPTAFETRNTGATLEVEPTLDSSGGIIDLRFAPEIVAWRGLATWCDFRDRWGDASVRMPLFEAWRTNTAVTVVDGRFELVSVIAPTPADPVPGQLRRILVFVRADVIRLHPPK